MAKAGKAPVTASAPTAARPTTASQKPRPTAGGARIGGKGGDVELLEK